jgi:uncharacterized membrane protein YkoI
MRSFVRSVAVMSSIAGFAAIGGYAAASDCMPWSSAGPVIQKNGLLPADVIYNKIQERSGGQIISVNLCQKEGRFFYKFVVLGKTGDVQKIVVDARTGR